MKRCLNLRRFQSSHPPEMNEIHILNLKGKNEDSDFISFNFLNLKIPSENKLSLQYK